MPSHEYFKKMCGLAADARIDPGELAELLSHIMGCESCRDAYEESLLAVQRRFGRSDSFSDRALKNPPEGDGGYRNRFLDRARREGFRFSQEVDLRRPPAIRVRSRFWKAQYAFGFFALVFAILSGVWAYRSRDARKAAVAALATSRKQNAELERANGRLRNEIDAAEQRRASTARRFSELSDEISAENRERAGMLVRIQELQSELAEGRADLESFAQSAKASEAERKGLSRELQERTLRMAQMSNQMQKLRSQDAGEEAIFKASAGRTEKLQADLREEKASLDRESRLLAADRDIRDLMGARKLHIIDVHDADEAGNNRRAFGRVFYTEGKSLIFYAFDLGNPHNSDSKVSFVGWGTHSDASGRAKELGIFYVDDAAQRRWVLKIDNPELLRQINAVFVTVEPARGSNRPTGEKLLYAFLDTQANHP
jgi:hypothetical protein